MSVTAVLRLFVSTLSVFMAIPAAFLCFIPMKHLLRRSKKRIVLHCGILMVLAMAGTALFTTLFPFLDGTVVLLPFLGLFFVYYAISSRAHVLQSAGIFLAVCGLYGILSFLAYAIDGAVHMNGPEPNSGVLFYVLQLGLIVAGSVPAGWFLNRWGTELVTHIRQGSVWSLISLTSLIIFAILSVMAPRMGEVFVVPEMRRTFLVVGAMVSLLYALSVAFFLMSSVSLMHQQELEAQETVYLMQRKQYLQLEDQTERMRILRHDFKHTLSFLQKLAAEDDMDGIREYLARYQNSIPSKSLIHYCDNDLINAILNHYADRAEAAGVRHEFLVDIVELSEDQTYDLITVLSNLLENAQQGCETVTVRDRSVRLKMSVINEENLYIIVTNSFDGKVRRSGDRYLSTRRRRGDRGMGLRSIERVVASYGGEVSFYHRGRIFCVDLTMKIRRKESIAS